jgi:hypothetical protein
LRIVPLPSEPEIVRCNNTVFERLKSFVDTRVVEDEGKGDLGMLADSGEETEEIDVEVVFYDQIGLHNITVIRAYTGEGFARYTDEFLEGSGLDPVDAPEAEAVASSYIERGIEYFVLDLMDLAQEVGSPEPLMYRFDSDSLYYPMEITSLTGGKTHILLFLLTPFRRLSNDYTEKNMEFLGERRSRYHDERYIKLSKPDSPVNFRLITHEVLYPSDFERAAKDTDFIDHYYRRSADDGVRSDNTSGEEHIEDWDMYRLYKFFEQHRSVQCCVYEYDGTVELTGDISVSEYSTLKVKEEEEFTANPVSFVLVLAVPLVSLVVIVIVLVRHLKNEYAGGSGEPLKSPPPG